MNGYDLIINDNEFHAIAKDVSAYENDVIESMKQYKDTLNSLSTNAIVSGATHDALVLFTMYVETSCNMVEEVSQKFMTMEQKYISSIDTADDYLYKSTSGTRDFSDKEYANLLSCLDDPWCDFTDSVGDWIMSKVVSVSEKLSFLDKINIPSLGFTTLKAVVKAAGDWLKKNKKALLDMNDATKAELKTLFEDVYAVDAQYGSTGVTSFGYFSEFYQEFQKYVKELAWIIDPSKGSFTVGAMRTRLTPIFRSMQEKYKNAIGIPETDIPPSEEIIRRFLATDFAWQGFSVFHSYACYEFFQEASVWDYIGTVPHMMFDNARDLIKAILSGKFLADDPELLSYSYRMKEKLFVETLETVAPPENALNDKANEYMKLIREAFGDGEDGAKELYKILNTTRQDGSDRYKVSRKEGGALLLDGRTKEAKQFQEFIKSFKNAKEILKYGTKGVEMFARMMASYELGIETIDSLQRNFGNDEYIKQIAAETRAKYEKELDGIFLEITETAADMGEMALETAFTKNPVGAAVIAVEKAIDIAGDVTGWGEHSEGFLEAAGYENLYSQTSIAYSNAYNKLKAADPNSEEYETLLNDFKNCFEMNKKVMVSELEAMAKASTGDKAAYYRYCAREASKMTMYDETKPHIMTYEEYTNQGQFTCRIL